MPKLTKRVVEAAEPHDKPYFIFDAVLPGFSLRIAPSGKRYYHVQYLRNKQTKRMSLGQHGVVTPEQARHRATKILSAVKDGEDPFAAAQEANKALTVRDLASRYLEEHVDVHCKPRTGEGYRRVLDKFILPAIGNMKITEVARADVAALHHSKRKNPYDANRCLEVISKMFNLAEMWGLRPDGTNPRRHIKRYPETKRERYLSAEEIQRLGKVLEEFRENPFENTAAAYAIKLLLFTGCRLGEILNLKWEYVDYGISGLRLPDSKTGAKIVYVGDVVVDLLKEIHDDPERPRDNAFVIWGREPQQALNNLQKPWRRIRKHAGIEDVRIHDLRHSFASSAVSMGQSLPMIGRLLGHTQVQTTARYAHLAADPVRIAADSVASNIAAVMDGGS